MKCPRRRTAAVACALVVVLGGLAVAGTDAATAADARLTLTDASVTPSTPAAGAPLTVSTTVRYSAGSNTSLDLDAVRLVRTDTGQAVGNATDLGTLTPGETLTVPVSVTVDETGVYDFRLVAEGTDDDGETARATRPLTIGVEPGAPQFEVSVDRLVTGADRSVAVEVSNPTTAALRDLDIALAAPDGDDQVRRTIPSLAPGATETLNVTVHSPDAGEAAVELRTTYTNPTGAQQTVTYTRPVEAVPPEIDVGIRATRAGSDDAQQVPEGLPGLVGGGDNLQSDAESDESGRAQLDVTVTNFGNAPVTDVVLEGRTADGAVLAAVGRVAVTDRLPPGASETVTVDLVGVPDVDRLRFVASYGSPDGNGETALAYDYAAPSGQAELTGLDVSVSDDGTVNVSGNVANTGTAEVTGAVVAVRPTDHVRPAYPQRTYFAGSVGASEFVPFDVTARADVANATAVTLAVTYTADGNRTTETVTVPLQDEDDREAGDGGSLQSLGLPLALAAVAVAATGTVVLAKRRTDQ